MAVYGKMSAHVLLDILNKLRTGDKMKGLKFFEIMFFPCNAQDFAIYICNVVMIIT